jgi:hypothetical protein
VATVVHATRVVAIRYQREIGFVPQAGCSRQWQASHRVEPSLYGAPVRMHRNRLAPCTALGGVVLLCVLLLVADAFVNNAGIGVVGEFGVCVMPVEPGYTLTAVALARRTDRAPPGVTAGV